MRGARQVDGIDVLVREDFSRLRGLRLGLITNHSGRDRLGRTTIAAGILKNTDENLARWLRDPQAVKEGSLMKLPAPLSDEQVTLLVAYLRAHQ